MGTDNTNECFQILLDDDYLWNRTGESFERRRDLRRRFKQGKVSLDKKTSLLEKAGFEVKVKVLWRVPEDSAQ